MRLAASIFALLLSSCVASNALSFFGSSQDVLEDDDLNVPGDNPLKFCEKENSYTLAIEKVDLDPNPPSPYVTVSFCSMVGFPSAAD